MIAQFVTTKEYLMEKIAVASALIIFLSMMTANAGGCPSNHAGLCAVAHLPAKYADKKRHSMRGALIGAYQR
jgi:hypothetical protein